MGLAEVTDTHEGSQQWDLWASRPLFFLLYILALSLEKYASFQIQLKSLWKEMLPLFQAL